MQQKAKLMANYLRISYQSIAYVLEYLGKWIRPMVLSKYLKKSFHSSKKANGKTISAKIMQMVFLAHFHETTHL